MLTKTLFASAATAAVIGLCTAALPASAQKAPPPKPAPDAAAIAANYADIGEELGLKDNQKAAFDKYVAAIGKAADEHAKWHADNARPPRGDRQAHFKYRADHQKFRADQFETLAGVRGELVKSLNPDQVELLDEMEGGWRFGPAPRGPRADGWGPHHRRGGWGCPGYGPGAGYGPGYGPGAGYGPGYGPGHGWGHPGWGHRGWGQGWGYGPGCNWNGCPWR